MKKRYIALMLAGLMAFTTGCAGNAGGQNDKNDAVGESGSSQEDGTGADYIQANAKGRFLESDIALPEMVSDIKDMELLEDGSVALFDGFSGYYVSKDEGGNFEHKEIPAVEELIKEQAYISNAVIGKDGSLLLTCYKGEEQEQGEESDSEDADETRQYDVVMDEEGNELTFTYIFVDAEGNVTECNEFSDVGFTNNFVFTEDGSVLAVSDGVYKMDFAEKKAEKICETKAVAEYASLIGDNLYILEGNPAAVEIYDMKKQEMSEDALLNRFCSEIDMSNNAMEGANAVLFYPGDTEDSIYVASQQGLFRHVVGGSVMEEVIKGSLSSMGSPSYALSELIRLEKDCFLILYNQSVLKKYVYDPDVAALPEKEVKIYSLEDNGAIRTAINLYQNEHPDTYIEYEVGMSGKDAETAQDAIRNLNTKLLSGEGPDVLVLDGLNIDSYTEKGILEDLSENMPNEDLYENVVKAYEKDGKICGVPVLFEVPVLAGEGVSDVNNLAEFVEYVEKKHAEKPDGSVTGSYTEKSVLTRLYDICSVGFMKEDGSVDGAKLKEYLTAAERIWKADSENMDPEIAAWKQDLEIGINVNTGIGSYAANNELYVAGKGMDYVMGAAQVIYGRMNGVAWDYSDVISAFRSVGQKSEIRLMNGLSENVFLPNTVLGVNSSSDVKETAEDFVKSMLSEEIQSGFLSFGIPVNKAAILSAETEFEYGEVMGGYMVEGADGEMLSMDAVWPSREEFDAFEKMLDGVTTPAYLNDTIKEIIINQGVSALKGEKSIESAVDEILNSVQIYLAE